MIKDSDLAGFTKFMDRFDIPFLAEEFYYVLEVDFDMKTEFLLMFKRFFHKMEEHYFNCGLQILLRTKFRKCSQC